MPQPTPAQLSTAMEKMEVDPDYIEIEEFLYEQRSIRWKFDITGGFVDFRYLGVYLTIPSFITDKLSIIELRRVNPSSVHLELGEFLVSDVISIHVINSAVEESLLKSPAFLEIPCKNTNGNTKYSRLAMIYYDTSANRWIEVEKIETSMEKCDYFGSVKTFPILQAWIFYFTKFAVISKPNVKDYCIGKDGDTCRPFEDENIEVHFAPGTFRESNCKCEIKVINPLNREIRQQNGVQLIISPIINVKTSLKTFSKPVSVKLPLLCKLQDGGTITVLKNDSNSPKNWNDITESLKSSMLFQDEAVTFQVTSFSWVLVAWVKDIAMHATDAALWAVERIFSNVFDATFHLYKRIGGTKYEVPIAVSCIPFTSNREEQEDLRRRPKQGGEFYLVASQPSLKKICDSECAVVKVTGQFDNDAVDLQKRMLRLSKAIGSLNLPTLFKVRRGRYSMATEGGDVEIIRETNNELFCNIPYFADFMSSQNEEFAVDGARRNSPFRFLGLRLDHCGLEDLKMTTSDFRNRLYLTGLHQTYIEEIKLSAEHESQQFITRNLLSLITCKFSRDELEENWFEVFRVYLWPDHARQKLNKVFDFLQMPPRLITEGDIIYDCIIADPDLPAVLGRLAELFIDEPIKHPSCEEIITNCKQSSKDECQHILSVYSRLKRPKTLLCVIKTLLLLLDDFPWTVQRILDNIGSKIEAHLQLKRI